MQGPHPVLVVFHGDGYGQPCKALAPLIQRVTADFSDLRVVELDDRSHLSIAETYLVEQVPTLFLFRHGSPVARLDGLRDDDATYSWVAEQFAGANEA